MKWPSSRAELDTLVVNVELTLASIIQGVALFFLTENARVLLNGSDRASWPYIFEGLLVIFIFWSRSIIHTFTLIRWPIEFPHNFFYIACALCEALLFTHLADPLGWFVFSTIYGVMIWLLFIYDLRLITTRETDSTGEASCRLYALVRRDQWLNIAVLMPVLFLFHLGCALSIRHWPEFFLVRQGHLWLIGAQIFAFAVYLFYVGRFLAGLAPLIGMAHAEWQGEQHE